MAVKKAVLLNTNGTHELVDLKGLNDYQKYIGGNIESLPCKSSYLNTNLNKRFKLRCYVNEEGMISNMPNNPWDVLLGALGMHINWSFGGLYGPVLVLKQSGSGEGSVDDYVLNVIKEFEKCENKDSFLTSSFLANLEKINS